MGGDSYDDEQPSDESSSDYEYDQVGNKKKIVYQDEEHRRKAKIVKINGKMKRSIGLFFKENTIGDLLPYNQKLVVLNHECTISQTIEAMVRQQNIRNSIIWNNEKREYQQIFTLRDLLECTLYVAEKLQEVINNFESK